MTRADIPAGLRLCRASGWNQLSRDWEYFLDTNPGGACVLERDGFVIGTVATLRFGHFGWVAMVLVDPAERKQGYGSRLLTAGLELLEDLPSVRLDATPAGQPLYRARRFVERERLSRMVGVVPCFTSRPPGPPVRSMSRADLPEVARWDAEAFGASRRSMLEWLYEGAPEYACVAERSGRIAGYALGRHGFDFEQLGPVVAESDEVATALVNAAFVTQAGRRFAIDAMLHTHEWIRSLESLGFREQRPFTRMERGTGPRGMGDRIFASVGPEFA